MTLEDVAELGVSPPSSPRAAAAEVATAIQAADAAGAPAAGINSVDELALLTEEEQSMVGDLFASYRRSLEKTDYYKNRAAAAATAIPDGGGPSKPLLNEGQHEPCNAKAEDQRKRPTPGSFLEYNRNQPFFNSMKDVEGQLGLRKVDTKDGGGKNQCLFFAFLLANGDLLLRMQKTKYAPQAPQLCVHTPDDCMLCVFAERVKSK